MLDAIKRPAVKLDPKTVGALVAECEHIALRTAEIGLVLDIRTDNGGNLPEDEKTEDGTEDEKTESKTEPKTRVRKTA